MRRAQGHFYHSSCCYDWLGSEPQRFGWKALCQQNIMAAYSLVAEEHVAVRYFAA